MSSSDQMNDDAKTQIVIAVAPLAVGFEAAGAMFSMSGRSWRRLDVQGLIGPRPIFVGCKKVWIVEELNPLV